MSGHASRGDPRRALILLVLVSAMPSRPAEAGKRAQALGMEERVACQEDLDALARQQRARAAGLAQVPDGGPAAAAASRRRAEDTVRLSRALQSLWGRAITPAQLQAEMNR